MGGVGAVFRNAQRHWLKNLHWLCGGLGGGALWVDIWVKHLTWLEQVVICVGFSIVFSFLQFVFSLSFSFCPLPLLSLVGMKSYKYAWTANKLTEVERSTWRLRQNLASQQWNQAGSNSAWGLCFAQTFELQIECPTIKAKEWSQNHFFYSSYNTEFFQLLLFSRSLLGIWKWTENRKSWGSYIHTQDFLNCCY